MPCLFFVSCYAPCPDHLPRCGGRTQHFVRAQHVRTVEDGRHLFITQREAEYLHIIYRQIGLLAHLALAYEKQGQRDDALEALDRSVRLAQPGGFIRTFVDLGPAVAKLLYQLSQRGVAPEYIGRILAAFPETPDTGEAGQKWSGKVSQAQLIEPLTEREFEVLVLLEEGLSNKEIAKKLVVTTRTVKKHTSNIYHKLGVHNRGKAVTKGKALGILSPD